MTLRILNSGSCETFKAGVHATALGLAAVMGLYNAAAWLRRREPHLALNAVLYGALIAWEQHHVTRHLRKRSTALELSADTTPGADPRKMPPEAAAA